MNSDILLVYPIINVIVTGLFAGVVLRQYLRRHRTYQFFWAIALLMAFFASLAYVAMILVHPTSEPGVLFFRIYYILGGALIAAWLGLGSIALVTSARFTRICLVALCVLSALAALLIAFATVDKGQLSQIAGTPGTAILQPAVGPWLITIIILNTLGAAAVAGVAIYSCCPKCIQNNNGYQPGTHRWLQDGCSRGASNLAQLPLINSGKSNE